MDLGEPPVLPYMALPEPPRMPVPILEVPEALVPSYKPIVAPPSDLRAPPGVKGKPLAINAGFYPDMQVSRANLGKEDLTRRRPSFYQANLNTFGS